MTWSARSGGGAVLVLVFLVGAAVLSGGGSTVPGDASTLPAPVDRSNGGDLEFRNVTNRVGLDYTYSGSASFDGRREMATNAGVYVTDFNNDHWPDILVIGGREPTLFRNVGGTFRGTDAVPELDRPVTGALSFDYDHDGWDDILLLGVEGRLTLLENRGGSFTAREDAFDLRLTAPIVATAGDYNDDGCVDVFVVQHGDWERELPAGFFDYSAPINADNGFSNYLFRGNCSSFTRANATSIRGNRWSLATTFADLNNDGRLDIYVANDFNHDIVYRNRGEGRFEQIVLGDHTNRNGMSSELADVNQDGALDIFTTNIFYPTWIAERLGLLNPRKVRGNTLLLNRENTTFVDRASGYGVAQGGWGWAAVIADLDNDGTRELVHATQRREFRSSASLFTDRELRSIEREYPFYRYPVIRDRDDGTFVDVSPSAVGFAHTDGRGLARVDYDRDGDMDLLFATTSRYHVYRNEAQGTALQMIVRGADGQRSVGARVTVTTGERVQTRITTAGTDFLSQDTGTVHFGLGDHARATVRVVWPDGTARTFRNVTAGQRIIVTPRGSTESIELS